MIDKIRCENRIGNDIHKELIAMWNELQNGWIPPSHITEEEYITVRDNKEKYPDYYVGFVGYHASFGSKYFSGYARSFKVDGITPRDQSNEAYRNTMKQVADIKDVFFTQGDYKEHKIKNAVIYCDPPYMGTTKYSTGSFNYEEFWDWCRKMSKENWLFVSEYNAPDDFECIWSKEHLANFDCNRGNDISKKVRVEKLFTYKG